LRQGDAIDPFHLANGFEAVIGYECQERSNHPFSHSYNAGKVLQCRQVGAGNMERYNQFIEASRSSLGVVLGDLVDVACVSNKTVISIIMYVDRVVVVLRLLD